MDRVQRKMIIAVVAIVAVVCVIQPYAVDGLQCYRCVDVGCVNITHSSTTKVTCTETNPRCLVRSQKNKKTDVIVSFIRKCVGESSPECRNKCEMTNIPNVQECSECCSTNDCNSVNPKHNGGPRLHASWFVAVLLFVGMVIMY